MADPLMRRRRWRARPGRRRYGAGNRDWRGRCRTARSSPAPSAATSSIASSVKRCPISDSGRRAGIDRRLADPAKRKPDIRAASFLVERDDRGDAGQRKIAAPARHLHEAAAGARLRLGKHDLHQHLIGRDIGREQRRRKNPTRRPRRSLACRLDPHPRPHGDRDRRQFGGRIGMRQVAADGAAIADLRMGDMRQRVGEQRTGLQKIAVRARSAR